MKNLIARNGGKFFLRMDVVGAPFDGDYLRRRLGKSASVPITRTRAAEEGSSTVATTSKLPALPAIVRRVLVCPPVKIIPEPEIVTSREVLGMSFSISVPLVSLTPKEH